MACISDYPNCGLGAVSTPLGKFGTAVGVAGTVASIIGWVTKAASLGASAGGGLASVAAVAVIIIVISIYASSRCSEPDGEPQCLSGCVSNLQPSFSEAYETIFPFAGMPDRVDVTVKSIYWGLVQRGDAYVYCTDAPYPKQSEIFHAYYYTSKLCAAETGSLVGAAVGGAIGVVAAIAATAAIGCITIILCILALLIAAIIAIAAAIAGAFAGGNIARAIAGNSTPSGTTPENTGTIQIGQFVTIMGNFIQSTEDNKADVFWFVDYTNICGQISNGTPQPYSYCDIDEQFTTDMDVCQSSNPGVIV